MNPDKWKQLDLIFDQVLEVEETDRKRIILEKCGDDAELKSELLSLLQAHDKMESFIEDPAIRIISRRLIDQNGEEFSRSLAGQTLGPYKLEKLIGVGGMGEVYLADDDKLKRKVALKILPPQYTSQDERVQRLIREAHAISALNHPNIVTIHDIGKVDSTNYIATEFVEGKTLRDLISEKPPVRNVLEIIIQCCGALAAAHRAGIIHRDIKPENIMVRPDGYVKILDFGLAKLTERKTGDSQIFAKTLKGTILGTPAYMSPEQASGSDVDPRTDLWSIGVVLYEILTGVNPFKKETRQATIQSILSEDYEPPSALNPQVPAELDRIIFKALEKDADLSYQSATDLIADLKRVRREIDSSPTLSGSYPHVQSKAVHRTFFTYTAAFVFLLIAGFGIWYFAFRPVSHNKATEWEFAHNIQITDNPKIDQFPSLAPDGKSLVYSSERNGKFDIFWQRVGGDTVINLTKDSDGNNLMAAFSPDGSTIAFRSQRNPSGIYLMGATGENVRRLTDIGSHPSWSPDGNRIVYSDGASALHTLHTTPKSSLWVVDVKTGQKKKLATGGDAIYPSWSPKGRRIAFWFVKEGKLGDIATVPAGGGAPKAVTTNPSTDWNPVWSPDGKYLYFLSDRSGNMGIWRVAIDEDTGDVTGNPESVPTPAKYCQHLSISQNGKLLTYVRYESRSNLHSLEFDPDSGKVIGEPRWITNGVREISHPALSPDGEQYVIREPSLSQEDLVIYDKNGNKKHYLTKNRFIEREPRWTPDGKRIFFSSNITGRYQIWSIKPDGTGLKQITYSQKLGASAALISPDGRKMLFTEIDGYYRIPLMLDLTKEWDQQTPQPILSKPDFHGIFVPESWSPEGDKILAFYSDYDLPGRKNEIVIYDLNAKNFVTFPFEGHRLHWLSDSRRFIYTIYSTIYLVDSETKEVKEIYKSPRYSITNTNLTGDSKMIYYRYLEVDSKVWLLDATQTTDQKES